MYYLKCRYRDGSFYRWIDQEVDNIADAIAFAEDEMARNEEIGTVDIEQSGPLQRVVQRRVLHKCENGACVSPADWVVRFRNDMTQKWCGPCVAMAFRYQPENLKRAELLANS